MMSSFVNFNAFVWKNAGRPADEKQKAFGAGHKALPPFIASRLLAFLTSPPLLQQEAKVSFPIKLAAVRPAAALTPET
jgi:hypothetical protein